MRAVSLGETLKDSPMLPKVNASVFLCLSAKSLLRTRADRRRHFPLPYVNARKTSDLNRRSALPFAVPERNPENRGLYRSAASGFIAMALACGLQPKI